LVCLAPTSTSQQHLERLREAGSCVPGIGVIMAHDLKKCRRDNFPTCFSALHRTPLTLPAALDRSLIAVCQSTLLLYRVATTTHKSQCVQQTTWASRPQSRCPTRSSFTWTLSKGESTSSRCLGHYIGRTSTLPIGIRCLPCKRSLLLVENFAHACRSDT
jgi:hypothetical protein